MKKTISFVLILAVLLLVCIVITFKGVNKMRLPSPAPLNDKSVPSEGIPAVDPSQEVLQAETWRAFELIFESEKTYSDPFSDAVLDLVLTDGNIQFTIPGFWDGENIWKVRVTCPTAGRWYYKTVCSDPENSDLNGKTGTVECAAYSGSLEVYKHGFVTTREGKKYFTYEDGTPFFYLGDTHWGLGDETPDMVHEIAERRINQGFTVWQSEPIGEQFDLTDGVTQADIQGFQNYDEKFRIIADYGLTHANAQFFYPASMEKLIENHGGYSDKTVAGTVDGKETAVKELSEDAKVYLEKLSRYWVARYGAYPVMWTLGQEVDNDYYWDRGDHPNWNALNNPYKLVAEYIEKYDMYSHPLTAHQEYADMTAAYGNGNGRSEKLTVYHGIASASAFRDVTAHNFYAAQWSPSLSYNGGFDVAKDYWYNSQGKPSINYEGRYCGLWTKDFGARAQGWLAYLNGMFGYGWGGQDTWCYTNQYGLNDDSDDGVDIITAEEKQKANWKDALEYPSSYQICYMRSFLEDGKWWELIPRFDKKAYFRPADGSLGVCAANKDSSETIVYFYSFTDTSVAAKPNTTDGLKAGTVGHLKPFANYTYRWFDPVNGEYGESGTFRASIFGKYSIAAKPSETDWAIRIERKDNKKSVKDFLEDLFNKKEEPKEGPAAAIIPNQGICDPHIHIFNGKAYLYATHDRGPGQEIFRMDDWRIYSSDDLVNWTLETTIHPEDTFLGKCEECYAPDAAERNGKYYFYFSHQQYQTGVMVSEAGPAGPFKDALGEPLLPPGLADTPSYDPTVFIDDDGNKTPYIMWGYTIGGKHYYIARLNEDMISLAEEPRAVEIINGWENDACWISKFNGVYYLNSHEGAYATSDSIYGPYTYRGKICKDCFTDHGTFFSFKGQDYFAYAVPENYERDEPLDRYYRTTKIVYAHLKENGEIVTDEFIKGTGVAKYDAGWEVIKGEWFFDKSGEVYKKENDGGFEMRGIGNGSYLVFPNISNMPADAMIKVRVAKSGDTPCTMEIRKEGPHGELLGKCEIGNTGGADSFKNFGISLNNTAGSHGLCFVFRTESGEELRFEDFCFEKTE